MTDAEKLEAAETRCRELEGQVERMQRQATVELDYERQLHEARQQLAAVTAERDAYSLELFDLPECRKKLTAVTAERDRLLGADNTVVELEADLDVCRKNLHASEAACGELRAALEVLHKFNRDYWCSDTESDREVRCRFFPRVEHALSTDAGKGWVSPAEHQRIVEQARQQQHPVAGIVTENMWVWDARKLLEDKP